jgi:hypothetical protein
MARQHLPTQAVSAIKTEIQTGRTFARVALDATDPKKLARNAANARKAYDTALAWAEKTFLSAADAKEIGDQLQQLKTELAALNVCSKESES